MDDKVKVNVQIGENGTPVYGIRLGDEMSPEQATDAFAQACVQTGELQDFLGRGEPRRRRLSDDEKWRLAAHDPVCLGIIELMTGRNTWRGTPEELYQAIKSLAMLHEAKFDGEFPANSAAMWDRWMYCSDVLLLLCGISDCFRVSKENPPTERLTVTNVAEIKLENMNADERAWTAEFFAKVDEYRGGRNRT
jgi:hypothetical protein